MWIAGLGATHKNLSERVKRWIHLMVAGNVDYEVVGGFAQLHHSEWIETGHFS
jgi:hypothetical protein